MPKKRKTFSIATLLHRVNKLNERSTAPPETRQGWNSILADVLLGANVYAGFNYLGPEDVPKGQRPGIDFQDKAGNPLTPNEFFARMDATREAAFLEGNLGPCPNGDERIFPDETRRFYYVDASLMDAYSKLPTDSF